jgi:oligoendopeptidase F
MLDVAAVPTRDRIPLEERWDLESVFPDAAAWEAAYRAAEARLPELDAIRGRLGDSAAALLAGLRLVDAIDQAVERVAVFALLRQSEDAGNARANEMADRASGLEARTRAAGAFVEPEIAAIPDAALDAWLAAEPGLDQFRVLIARIQRRRPHIRSAEVEAVLARAGEMAAVPEQVHTVLENGELPLGTIRDEEGAEVTLAQGNVDRYLHSSDRRVRRDAWEQSADGYLAFANTFAATLAGAVKRDNFYARERRYATALEAALAPDDIPVSVFHNLIDVVWANFPLWHRYFRARRRLLGLPAGDLQPWDLEAPLAISPDVKWDEGADLVYGALAPLGDDYVGAVRHGIADRWVDRAANAGKGGGAFSWGAYDTFPFISMTWHDDLGSVSTLIHELGHSMHSYLTARHQPFTYAQYGMIAAETASNFNQALLGAHLLAERADRDWTLAVLDERMANFQRYLFTMPILARFELACHERVMAGEALPSDWMNETLLDFYREGYGGEVVIDPERIGITWARFPHLFANFYVFQYGIGIAAAAALATTVRETGEPARERYLEFFRAGGSKHSIDALRDAGIDMRSREPIQRAFDLLATYVDRLEALADD